MLKWMVDVTSRIAWRLLLTLACCVTIENLIRSEGYRCSLSTIVIAAVAVVVVCRAWVSCECCR